MNAYVCEVGRWLATCDASKGAYCVKEAPRTRAGATTIPRGGLAQDDAVFRGWEERDRNDRGRRRRIDHRKESEAPPGQCHPVRRCSRSTKHAPTANAPSSGSIRDPDNNLWRRELDRWTRAERGRELALRDDDIPPSPLMRGQARVSGCSEDAKPTSPTPLQTGNRFPRAERTAAFWRSVDAWPQRR